MLGHGQHISSDIAKEMGDHLFLGVTVISRTSVRIIKRANTFRDDKKSLENGSIKKKNGFG
jgi:hypothetical protein